MAAGVIAKPGTEYGPCLSECKHLDCAESRKQAETLCPICNKKIGYDRRFFQENNWEILTHEICKIKQIEKEKNDVSTMPYEERKIELKKGI